MLQNGELYAPVWGQKVPHKIIFLKLVSAAKNRYKLLLFIVRQVAAAPDGDWLAEICRLGFDY